MSRQHREFLDSREGFDYHPTPDDWAEYEQWIDWCEYNHAVTGAEEEAFEQYQEQSLEELEHQVKCLNFLN